MPARLLGQLWPAIEPHATKACRFHRFLNADDLLFLGLSGKAQFFIVAAEQVLGFVAMEITVYPRMQVAGVLAAGGARGSLGVLVQDVLPLLVDWAREQGAQMFSISGRPGWLKLMRPLGFNGIRYGIASRSIVNE